MFIVNYKDGKSISEDQMKWDDIPKDGISAVQLKWSIFDFITALRSKISDFSLMINGGQQFKAEVENLIALYRLDRSSMLEHRNIIANKVIDKVKETLISVEKDIDNYMDKIKVLIDLKKSVGYLNDQDDAELQKQLGLKSRSESNRNTLIMIMSDMEAFLTSELKISTLLGSSEHKYQFFQFKENIYNLTAAKDMGTFEQKMGMVIDKSGRAIVCEMNLRTGQYKIYVTTLESLKLDFKVFPYIKLEEVE
jgi:hypothetical protein